MIDVTAIRSVPSPDAPWHACLDRAVTVGETVTLVRDFLASVPPEALAMLPEPCRHVRVKAEDDIEYWTFRLSDAHRLPGCDAAHGEVLHELFSLLLHASLRIAHIDREQARAAALAQ
jgi:hypothetical protein